MVFPVFARPVVAALAVIGLSTNLGAPVAASGDAAPGRSVRLLTLTSAIKARPEVYREQILWRFNRRRGDGPVAGLIPDKSGALYGTTTSGGDRSCGGGCGVVFKLTPSSSGYTMSDLYRFTGGNDGLHPSGGLAADATGALYGTTYYGGTGPCLFSSQRIGCGTVFKLTPSGSGYTESVVYSFQGGNDGANPLASLIADTTGALYSTTLNGGSSCNCGTVFKLTPSRNGYNESVLYSFRGGNDGAHPWAGLMSDATGALYSTTNAGGTVSCDYGFGCGTVFKLTPSRTGYKESVLYAFHGKDGFNPVAELIADTTGALYSTTSAGGKHCGQLGCGTVFKLTPSGSGYTESVLYSFQGGSDGDGPSGGLTAGANGALYGTTEFGGRSCACGTVFKLTPSRTGYTEGIVHRFRGKDGALPTATLLRDKSGALFGTTSYGGAGSCNGRCGTVFKLTP